MGEGLGKYTLNSIEMQDYFVNHNTTRRSPSTVIIYSDTRMSMLGFLP